MLNLLVLKFDPSILDFSVILEKIVQFQYPKSWKMYLLGLQIKHVILKICNILTSDTKFYPHHFNIIRVTGC